MTWTRRFLLGAGAGLALSGPAQAQPLNFTAAAAYSAQRRGVSLLVWRKGRVVFEDYPAPGGPDRAWELASGTKSFSGVMAAAAVQDGMLRLDERCAETLAEWRGDPDKSALSVRQLLTLTGGVGAGRIGRPPTYADAVAMPLSAPPGTRFLYGPAPFQVFGEIMRRKLLAAGRPADPLAYLQARIFDPLGIAPQRWRRGADGLPHLPSGAALTARDWATFGAFVLRGGREGGRRLVDPVALGACFEGTAVNPGYGLTWWLLKPGLKPPGRRAGIDESARALGDLGLTVSMAAGAGDQRLYLFPEEDMIVARQSSAVFDALRGRAPDWSDAAFVRLLRGL